MFDYLKDKPFSVQKMIDNWFIKKARYSQDELWDLFKIYKDNDL